MRFADWLASSGMSQEAAAKALKITQGRVSQLIKGGWPGREVAARIKELSDGQVTPDDFLTEQNVAGAAE